MFAYFNWSGLLWVCGFYVVLMLGGAFFTFLGQKRHQWKMGRIQCPHGIAGGQVRLKNGTLHCNLCEQEEDALQRKREIEILEAKRIEKNLIAVNSLKRKEFTRLTQLRAHKLDFLLNLQPVEFESIIAEMYRKLGYSAKQTPISNDFGRDIILEKNGEITFVECKRYGTNKLIGRPPLQKFHSAMITFKANDGVVVTTSDFTDTAKKFATDNKIKLINGSGLSAMMSRAFPDSDDAEIYRVMCRECQDIVVFNLREAAKELQCRNGHRVQNNVSLDMLTFEFVFEVPYCEKCGAEMRLVKKYHRKFWGCSRWPKCKSTKLYTQDMARFQT
jgi:restriction system protein